MVAVADEIRSGILSKNRLLGQLAAHELEELLAAAQVEAFEPQQTIFSKGDPGRCLYAVLVGRVVINTISSDGQEILLNILDAGEIFGEIAVLDGGVRTAGAVAIEPTKLLRIDRHVFVPFLERHPKLCIRVMEVLCERLRRTSDVIEDTIFLEIPRRLAKKLLDLAVHFGKAGQEGVQIDIKLSQEDLGSMLGVTRESVNKGLKKLQALGIISYDRGQLVICNIERLRSLGSESR